ncbi:RagB/SusD family nutrient uptake outer membrane protein, partial [Sphingobacterium sp.]|uniref:RagB/SusD family nutrient uptake outer membrane protein n=1 Tax=Sphingobacterium sp. TaxID=341027 RepID=UPI002897F7E4
KITLLKFIFQERIREFAGLGYRWFDMRRLYQDPELKDQINFSHNVYGANGTIESSYKLNEARLTLRIPPKILLENPQMKDNQ